MDETHNGPIATGPGEASSRVQQSAGVPSIGSAEYSECPAAPALALMGQKWTMLIIHSLVAGRARHSELRHRLGGLNSTTLSQRLKVLENEGIVTRQVLSSIPPWVEYGLTQKGCELAEILGSLDRWGRKWSA